MERLETQRLILRPFCKDDVDAIYDIFSDLEVNRFLPWFPLQSKEEAQKFLEERYLSQESGYQYAICLKNNHVPIGYIHVSGDESHDFGYGLKKEFWHQGIVSEACQVVIEVLKKDNIPFITATHDILNPHSGMVMKKIGMTYQYTYQEHWMPKDIDVTFRMYQLNFQKDIPVYKKYWDMYPHSIEKNNL